MKVDLDYKIFIPFSLFILLFLPSLFEPISYGDECIYLTLGNAFRRGLVFYKDIHDNKPPLLYLTAALGQGHLFWFRLISLAWNLIHLGIIYELTTKLTKKKWLPVVTGLIFTLTFLIFEGRIANGENFMMMPVSLAVYIFWSNRKKLSTKLLALIGFLFSIGFLYKIPVGFDFAGIMLALFLLKPSFQRLKEILITSASFALPIILSIIYYTLNGAFTPYVRSALMQNIGYLSSWQGSNLGLYIRFGLLITFAFVLSISRKKISPPMLFFSLWFIFGLFGALLSGRPYPHYFIEIVPSLAILIALTFDKISVKNIALVITAFSLIIISYIHFEFWWYPILPYYQNFTAYILGNKPKKEFIGYWGERTVESYQLAKKIKRIASPQDRIFVWGEGSCVYALSKRLPPGRYTVNYHIYDFDGYEETARAIAKTKPKVIVKMFNEGENWPKLNQIIASDYYRLQAPELKDRVYVRYKK